MKLKTVGLAALCFLLLAGPVDAAASKSRLGEDPAGDGVPGLDITYLEVGRTGAKLEVSIGVTGMTPQMGGYPELPGIEWSFEVGGRQFVAEAVAGRTQPTFYLFELVDGQFKTSNIEGTYDPADGFISMRVPLKAIGARSGSRLVGFDSGAGADVDAHVHIGVQTIYPDVMETTKAFLVP